MIEPTGIDAAEAAARALLDTRLAPIRDLAAAKEEQDDLLAKLAEVGKTYARAYAAAQTTGWSVDELHQLNYAEPTKRAPGRPARRAKAPTRRASRPTSSPAPETAASEDTE